MHKMRLILHPGLRHTSLCIWYCAYCRFDSLLLQKVNFFAVASCGQKHEQPVKTISK